MDFVVIHRWWYYMFECMMLYHIWKMKKGERFMIKGPVNYSNWYFLVLSHEGLWNSYGMLFWIAKFCCIFCLIALTGFPKLPSLHFKLNSPVYQTVWCLVERIVVFMWGLFSFSLSNGYESPIVQYVFEIHINLKLWDILKIEASETHGN